MKSNKNIVKQLCFTGVFAALVCAATFIAVPLPFGYFNLGDCIILLGAWCLGPIYGALAAGIGSGLADLFMGYAIYAPGTFFIKAGIAFIAAFLFAAMAKRISKDFISRLISAVAGEFWMVLGYFIYESVLLGYGMGATASIFGNMMQGICGTLAAVLLIGAMRKTGSIKKTFGL